MASCITYGRIRASDDVCRGRRRASRYDLPDLPAGTDEYFIYLNCPEIWTILGELGRVDSLDLLKTPEV